MWKIVFLFVLSVSVLGGGARGEEEERKIGDDCELNEDCENIDHAVCNFYDVCNCKEGYTASQNYSSCLRLAIKIGDECEIEEQCSNIPTAQCKGNICVVAQAVTSPPATTSVKPECTEDSQCPSNFLLKRVCRNGTCVMAPITIAPTVPQLDAVLIGKPCSDDGECTGEGMTCSGKLCKCKEGFVPSQNLKTCQQQTKLLSEGCTNAQCMVNGTVCEDGKCIELTQTMKKLGGKISALLIGSTCQHDNECKHMSHALCLENVCQCGDGYVTSVASDSCLEKTKEDTDKQVVVGTKLDKANSGSVNSVPKLALAAILFVKSFSL